MTKKSQRHNRVLMLIAIFKFFKAAVLILAGLAALELINPTMFAHAEDFVWSVGSPWIRDHLERGLAHVGHQHPGRLRALGVGAFVYAAVFIVEGTGLWLEKRWAEYLTIIVTGSFIPFEIWELTRRFTFARVATIVVNIAVVVYLILHLRHKVKNGDA